MVRRMAEEPKVVFAQSMEGLYRALQPLQPLEQTAFLKAGVKGDGKFAAAYPLELYMDVMKAASARFPELEHDARYREVGKLFIGGFTATLMGSAMLGLLKVLGPRRALDRLTRSFRAANNFTGGSFTSLAPNHHRVVVDYTLQPGFYWGLLEETLRRVGARDLVITIHEKRELTTTYDVSWKE